MRGVEIAIVGGGPAGAATACGLAAAGREVLLLERSAGPRHKVCGEFLSLATVVQLGRLGIDPRALEAATIDHVAVAAGGRAGVVPLPFPALSLSRYRLDEAILEQAAKAGAELWRGVAVEFAERQSRDWRLRCRDGEEIRCRTLVLATGKRSLRGFADRLDGSMVGLKMHLRLSPASRRALSGCVELFLLAPGYAGLELVEGGVATLCLILPRAVVARIGSGWPALRDYLASTSASLADRLSGALALWEKPLAVVCPAGGLIRRPSAAYREGIYPVGDRLAHVPPFAGEGLAIALCSAEMAARHIRCGSPPPAFLAETRRLAAPAIRLAAGLSLLTSGRLGRAVVAGAAAHAPSLLQMLARRTRIGRLGFAEMEAR
ncbi:MAG TPA: FAD-dependent monooxygenase [Stellaceae bacterium]|nr:FAD-dependent monooxygenase [Stellaceae bacterium]